MSDLLLQQLQTRFGDQISAHYAFKEVTIEVLPENLLTVCKALRDEPGFEFNQLVDVCGVDYLHYGLSEWETEHTTESGFDRAALRENPIQAKSWNKPRFAVAYHLLSTRLNQRVRVKVYLGEENPVVDSVMSIWPSADWFERETFDMFGIVFKDHPDLRRILTDYGFIGHPFRKDFPLSGHVEVRYDKAQGRVVYQAVDIEPRVLVPRVIRDDSRYEMDPTTLTGETRGSN